MLSKQMNSSNKEHLTWGTRLTIYKYLETHMLLAKITNLSKKERKHLTLSQIAGNRRITLDLPTKSTYRQQATTHLELLVSLASHLTLRIGEKECWRAKDKPAERLARFVISLPEIFDRKLLSIKIVECKTFINQYGKFLDKVSF